MRVIYHSALVTKELERGDVFRAVPSKAYLEIKEERNEQDYEVLLNGSIVDSKADRIDIGTDAELVIRTSSGISTYTVKPLVRCLSNEYAIAYEQFQYEYSDKLYNEIESILVGSLKMYAVDQSAEVYDWTEIFDKIEDAFKAFKSICEKPKSHLKAVNEVRPIETVKRIGYESIPYLAAHSEDWLAKTASGLKPARLFSRVEDDEYQIYENRVVKSLIDRILSFLRKKEKELKDQYEQLNGIINSSVQTGSFGFDVSFQKAVAELIVSDDEGDSYRSKALELAEKLHERSKLLLKKYRTLRTTRLYRYLKKSKAVSNPLNETNILLMDKHYNVIFMLWKEIHRIIAPKQITEEKKLDFKNKYDNYSLFCKALCGYTAHVLNFDIEKDGLYFRKADNLELSVDEHNGLIEITLLDRTKRSLTVSNGLQVPIKPNTTFMSFSFDGVELSWNSNVSSDEIEDFCSLFKTRESRGREQAEEQKRYRDIKQALDKRQREYPEPKHAKIIICPAVVELANDTYNTFKEYAIACAKEIAIEQKANYVVVALPRCSEDEQRVTEYSKYDGCKSMVLPLTMFDINSFRRVQNVLLRIIVSFNTGTCPSCGNKMRQSENQWICDNCYHLVLTKTICPDCAHNYYYLSYDVSPDTVLKMQRVDEDNFYQVDSLYQYKDIVPMSVESGKIRTICPCCHNN